MLLLSQKPKGNGIELNVASMGRITQTLQEVINDRCTQQEAENELICHRSLRGGKAKHICCRFAGFQALHSHQLLRGWLDWYLKYSENMWALYSAACTALLKAWMLITVCQAEVKLKDRHSLSRLNFRCRLAANATAWLHQATI